MLPDDAEPEALENDVAGGIGAIPNRTSCLEAGPLELDDEYSDSDPLSSKTASCPASMQPF